jgi:predicted nucleic-acid-binding protein
MPDARTYNRVVRLLQNREFPVDRDEIEAVATNAYELSHEEFDAVIRLAIDRGVLEEEDGKLVLPGSD